MLFVTQTELEHGIFVRIRTPNTTTQAGSRHAQLTHRS